MNILSYVECKVFIKLLKILSSISRKYSGVSKNGLKAIPLTFFPKLAQIGSF
jgi:hypothetical protein